VAKHRKEPSKGNAVLEKAQNQAHSYNAYDRPHADLREFIARAERAGEIARIAGADWKLEMGTLAEIVNHARPEPPAILFEDVPGYPAACGFSPAPPIRRSASPSRSACRFQTIRSTWCAPIATA